MHRYQNSIFCTVMLSLITIYLPAPTHASSEAGYALEEVMVTARRRSESIRDVPGTVSVLTEDALESSGVRRAEDFIELTPGVSMVNAAEVGDTQVNIRGINGARDAENSFAFLIDGILYTNPAAFNREFTNLQQIEVFKGPQGAIYGRSAAAGAILVRTTKPSNQTQMAGKISLAEDQSVNGDISYSGALKEDELYLSLSADWRKSDGFYTNSFQNKDIVDNFEGYNLNARLVWDVSDDLSIDSKLRYGEVDASSIVFNSIFHLPIFAAATGTPAAYQDSNDVDYVFQPNIVSDNDMEALEFSVKFDYTMDSATLTGWFLYSDIDNNFIADGTSAAFGFFNNDPVCQQSVLDLNAAGVALPSPQFIGTSPVGVIFDPNGSFLGAYTPTTCDGIQDAVRNQQDSSFELRLASPADQQLRWMTGVYFLDIDREVGVALNRDGGNTPKRGLLQLDGPNRTASLTHDQFDTQVLSIFGQIEYDINDSTEIAFALRYDSEDRDVSSLVPTDVTQSVIDLNFDTVFNDPLNPALSSLINPTGTIPDKNKKFSELQPKISLTWDATDTTKLFASWGVGFKAGGFNNSGSAATVNIFINGFINGGNPNGIFFADDMGVPLPVINDDYEEETSSAFEVGFKTRLLGGRMEVEGAAYHTTVDNMQFFEFMVGTFGLLRVVSNIDEVEISGAELGLRFRVTDNFSLYAGANVTDSEILSNSSRPDTIGNVSPYTPDFTVNAGANLILPVTNSFDFFARIDAQLIGETWFHTVQEGSRPTIFQPLFELGFGAGAGALGTADFSNALRDSYSTVDIRVGFSADTWTLAAFALNVTDEKYPEEIIPAPEFGGTFDHPNARRRYGVELSMKF
ncbi:MAG: TonB-dependent receptor [Gammaproteobacteria bacterium]|nr:TonB-dependent receptor [Gammaproteobacteria bacterium]